MKHRATASIVFFISFGLGVSTCVLWQQINGRNQHFDFVASDLELRPTFDLTNSLTNQPEDNKPQRIDELYMNDSRIGHQRRNKVEVRCFERGDYMIAEIKFYSRLKGQWLLRQSFEFEKDHLTPCDPKVRDFNNDGFKDLTYRSNVAARGANEVRKLFLYDKKRDELILVKNSEDYPNLEYNRKLGCLDAWLFHGSTTTVFLRIEGDELKEFAAVDTGLERVVSVTGRDGTNRVLNRKKMHEDDVYTRYSSFNPPIPR